MTGMLLGRTQETKYLESCYKKDGNQLIVMYGCENIGKTALLMDFGRSKPFSYYLARSCSEAEQLKFWADETCQNSGAENVYPEYPSLFSAIASEGNTKLVVVIDEFQYLVKNSDNFMREIIHLIHNRYSSRSVMVILCSSSVGFVENSMVTRIGEAAYEITGFLKVKELGFLELVRCFPEYDTMRSVELYSIFGGVPGLWRYFSKKAGIRENICHAVLQNGTMLHMEAERFVAKELREPSVYHTILNCIASGKRKLNDLYRETGFSRAKISVYLKNLTELEIVEKVFSVDTKGRDHAMKGLYRIRNHFVDFWFRFVFPNYSMLQIMTPEEFYDHYIAPHLTEYTAGYFPQVCREYLNLLNQAGRLPMRFEKTGSWVGKDGTIDIVAQDREGRILVGYCIYSDVKMTQHDYDVLGLLLKQAHISADFIYLFSAGGFEDGLKDAVQQKGAVELVSLSQM